jgi:hypothetical protein
VGQRQWIDRPKMPSHLPLCVQYIQALGAPLLAIVVAIVGALLAWQQVRLARVRLQHDLYDRRFAVFAAARRFFHDIEIHRNATEESCRAYLSGIADAMFLFDDENFANYLDDLRKKANRLRFFNDELKRLEVGEQRTKVSERIGELMMWFDEQWPILVMKFKPYLTLPRI